MVCLQQERENLTNQLSANPAALKAWLESFGVIRAWSKSYLGGIEWLTGFVWGCFDKLHQKPFWHYKHPQVEDGCDEYICILRDFIKQRVLMSIGIIAKY